MITVRALEPQDLDALIALGELAVLETRYNGQGYDPVKIRHQLEAYFKDERRKYIWLIGFNNGVLQGLLFGSVEEYWFTQALGVNMIAWYVAKEARGSSMAVKLLLAFRRWGENRNATELTLSVTSGLRTEKTGRFLQRMGFRRCGENFYQPLQQQRKVA